MVIKVKKKLKKAKVLCIGVGGIGSPLSTYLAVAGIGNIGIIDNDQVEISNLQRQILFNTDDINKNKAIIAAKKLKILNPNINIKPYQEKLTIKMLKIFLANMILLLIVVIILRHVI